MAPSVSVPCSVNKTAREEKTHIQAHEQHPLTLVTTPATGNVPIICRACGGWILGWRYSCSCRCNYYLHAACAHWPKTIETAGDHEHPLNLHFSAGPQPRSDEGINYTRCGHGDKGLWGYDCSTCGSGFFQHLDCAAAIAFVASEDPLDVGETVDTMVDVANGIGNNDGGGAAIDGPGSLWELVELLVPNRFSAPISLVTQLVPPDPAQTVSATAPNAAPANNQTSHHDDDCCCDDVDDSCC
ncbi:uncharacterized protein LOC116247476 [Nymphaea colorata]|nr:uncharacterized protein LOC116247476 [Nymphaea colorata]